MSRFVIQPTGTAAHLYGTPGERGVGDNSGVDLRFPETTVVAAGQSAKINLQARALCCDAKSGAPQPYWLLPRSSIGKTPLRLANSVGLIDRSYRGPLIVVVHNTAGEDFKIEAGTSLFQVATGDLSPPLSVKVAGPEFDFGSTERGSGGFGSTGKSGAVLAPATPVPTTLPFVPVAAAIGAALLSAPLWLRALR